MKWFRNTARVFRQEWKVMLTDPGLILFFVALPLMYPIVYTLIYNPEQVRKIEVAVVDDCRSQESRELVRQASASPAFALYGYASNMSEAKDWWAEQKVYAILHIPYDYGKKINQMEQAHATMYTDMSLLLRYRALMSAMSSIQMKLASDITTERIQALGAESLGVGMPVQTVSHFLGDTQQGFASFVIPGIVVLIMQQSLILGVGLLGGTARERRRKNFGYDPLGVNDAGALAQVWGKALAYTIFYIPVAIYILHYVPEFFHLPHYGNPVDYLLLMFPLLLASAFLGQLAVIMIWEREFVFLVVVFTSLIFLFLSGLTWPRYSMSPFWLTIGDFVPATWGIEGFIRINSNAATLAENARCYIALWLQVLVYSFLAAMVWKYMVTKERAKFTSSPATAQ
ncbi:MAG: ABC transporter permease [Bacteroidales bacterium]|nr:ABC transporter permease [Bacteroidales bacterium]